MASAFKKDRSRVKIINSVDMLLMVEKGSRGGICHASQRYAATTNKHIELTIYSMKNHIKCI